ncbi:hypothetical protein [Sphingosinicella rhizophila]|uniref:SnoaL-like domain-containing protein n=1 Tax=Sphingosinicella rhizophila TaxID=3050082 RepID=A0ABU3Q7E4_9SPHN|nr:hypothetical protein [Sphingosinicella sp. GR2756]MDT9599247.1 hypothetical protein [Sphingosinicella sp. GR2756]
MKIPLVPLFLLLLSCDGRPPAAENASGALTVDPRPSPTAPPDQGGKRMAAPPDRRAKGMTGGLPDDRTPVAEAPFAETSAQGAANVVRTYYALLEQGEYGDAWRLWSGGGAASGMSERAFAASFAGYREFHARIGAPGAIHGAAGSLYVEVPVRVHGRMKDGRPFDMAGPVTLRRVNDVPGSTAEQRLWHISGSGVRPRP